MTGQRFGRLVAISFIGLDNSRGAKWLFQCDCGKTKTISRHSVVLGKTKSCGCLNLEVFIKMNRSAEKRIKCSEKMRGEKCHFWRGGLSQKYRSERGLAMQKVEYKIWRSSVFERDGFACQNCGEVGGRLQADHIKPWKFFPLLRYDISNGRTLCTSCHRRIGWNLFRENNPMKQSMGITA